MNNTHNDAATHQNAENTVPNVDSHNDDTPTEKIDREILREFPGLEAPRTSRDLVDACRDLADAILRTHIPEGMDFTDKPGESCTWRRGYRSEKCSIATITPFPVDADHLLDPETAAKYPEGYALDYRLLLVGNGSTTVLNMPYGYRRNVMNESWSYEPSREKIAQLFEASKTGVFTRNKDDWEAEQEKERARALAQIKLNEEVTSGDLQLTDAIEAYIEAHYRKKDD